MMQDYNDLPLGRIARNIQDSVAEIYHAARDRREKIVCPVPDEDLKLSADYWLKKKNVEQEFERHSERTTSTAPPADAGDNKCNRRSHTAQ